MYTVSHERNAYHSRNEILFHTHEDGHNQRDRQQQVLVKSQRNSNPYMLPVGKKNGVATVEKSGIFLKT